MMLILALFTFLASAHPVRMGCTRELKVKGMYMYAEAVQADRGAFKVVEKTSSCGTEAVTEFVSGSTYCVVIADPLPKKYMLDAPVGVKFESAESGCPNRQFLPSNANSPSTSLNNQEFTVTSEYSGGSSFAIKVGFANGYGQISIASVTLTERVNVVQPVCTCPMGRRELAINPDVLDWECKQTSHLKLQVNDHTCSDGSTKKCEGPQYECRDDNETIYAGTKKVTVVQPVCTCPMGRRLLAINPDVLDWECKQTSHLKLQVNDHTCSDGTTKKCEGPQYECRDDNETIYPGTKKVIVVQPVCQCPRGRRELAINPDVLDWECKQKSHLKLQVNDHTCLDGTTKKCAGPQYECRDDNEVVYKGTPKATTICCKAMTATCLSCADGITEEEYCTQHPLTQGCPTTTICCKAMTAACLSCADGITVEEYCTQNPLTQGCPEPTCKKTNRGCTTSDDCCDGLACESRTNPLTMVKSGRCVENKVTVVQPGCMCPMGRRELAINPDTLTWECKQKSHLKLQMNDHTCSDGSTKKCAGPQYECRDDNEAVYAGTKKGTTPVTQECMCPIGRRKLAINRNALTWECKQSSHLKLQVKVHQCANGTTKKCEGPQYECRDESDSVYEGTNKKKESTVEQKYESTTEPSKEMLDVVKNAHGKRGAVKVTVTKRVKTKIKTTDTPVELKAKLEATYKGSEVTVVETQMRRRLVAGEKTYDVTIDNLPKTTSTAGFVDEVKAVLPGSTVAVPTVKFVTTVTTTLKQGTGHEQAGKDAKADLKTIEDDASAGFTSVGQPKVTKGAAGPVEGSSVASILLSGLALLALLF